MTTAAGTPVDEVTGLAPLQRLRQRMFYLAAALAVLSLAFVESSWRGGEHSIHEGIELFGGVLIAAAILGRMWATLYIGGRKSREIVKLGPYSVSRNPLYLFSMLAIAGVGFQTGSIVVGLVLVGVSLAIFVPVIRREERALESRFGATYDEYRRRVPRFGPKLSNWIDAKTVVASPRLFWRTLRDSLPLLLAFPVCEAMELLQASGYLVPMLSLP